MATSSDMAPRFWSIVAVQRAGRPDEMLSSGPVLLPHVLPPRLRSDCKDMHRAWSSHFAAVLRKGAASWLATQQGKMECLKDIGPLSISFENAGAGIVGMQASTVTGDADPTASASS